MTTDTTPEATGAAVTIFDQGEFQFYAVSDTGITFKHDTPKETWLSVVRELTGMYEGLSNRRERAKWMLGDALNFGERAFGEEFAQAVDGMRTALGLTPKSVANISWIASKVPSQTRRDGLTIAHHEAVAALSDAEQSKWLTEAEEHSWSVSEINREVALAELSPEQKEQINDLLSDNKTVEDLAAAQIRKMKKRIETGEQPKERKAVIDLESEEGLMHACRKVADYLNAQHGDHPKRSPLRDWSEDRKRNWIDAGIVEVHSAVRRMGLKT